MYCSTTSFTGTFDVIVVNVGSGWISASNSFSAPITGTYYLSYSWGSPAGSAAYIDLLSAGLYYCDSVNYETNKKGLEISSRGCLLNMNSGATIKLAVRTGSVDSSYGQTTFRGFLYAPIQGTKIAWSVHLDGTYLGATGYIPLSVVYLNVGNAWNTGTYRATIPTTGTYYLEIVTQLYNGPVDMRIMLNFGSSLARIYLGWTNFNWITRSCSVIVYLKVGDFLTVNVFSSGFSGNLQQGTSFQGFLLYMN